jgi:polyphosphate kinase
VHHLPDPVRLFLNPELSLLAFQRRVLALAEDPAVPLLERLRFLGIVTSNMDELYMVRMAELRLAASDRDIARQTDHGDGLSAQERLHAVEAEIASILAAQARCADACLADARAHGVTLLSWQALTSAEQHAVRAQYLDEIEPDLTPLAITLSPGVPLPHLPHLGLFVAIVYRATGATRTHLAEHELPTGIPRLLPVPGRTGAVILLEDVLRANVHSLYPNAVVEAAYLFRVTRGGDLHLHEDHAHDLLGAVAAATQRRPQNPAVRVEVEAQMPDSVRALILDNLQRDALGREMITTVSAVQPVDGVLDLRCLQSLPLPGDVALSYPPLHTRSDAAAGMAMFDAIRNAPLLVHHPFEAFDASVVRFFDEAAEDPDVTSISATLYRVGNPSPIVDALLRAARAGKRVFAFVELQARFDEAHNVQWARALERAGGQVVYGLPGLKVHAKVALVERRAAHTLERFAHVGTGNYNPRTGRQYTDLSLFSCDDSLTRDIDALLTSLAASRAPDAVFGSGMLVAPHTLLPGVLHRIEREAEHARAGRAAFIRIKVNGLADRDVVRALYAASQAGVTVELIVRGICILRPGVPGLSERIRVLSVVGRFLEHSRIYCFGNGGDVEYLIGSSDLRPRNLRRRVEVLVRVRSAEHGERLRAILDAYVADATAWELRGDGTFILGGGPAPGAQAHFSTAADAVDES